MIRMLLGAALFIAGAWWGTAISLQQAHEEHLTLWQLIIGYNVREPFWDYAGARLYPIVALLLGGAGIAMWGYASAEDAEHEAYADKERRLDNELRIICAELQVTYEERYQIKIKLRDAGQNHYRFKNPELSSFELRRENEGTPYLVAQDDKPETLERVEQINARVASITS